MVISRELQLHIQPHKIARVKVLNGFSNESAFSINPIMVVWYLMIVKYDSVSWEKWWPNIYECLLSGEESEWLKIVCNVLWWFMGQACRVMGTGTRGEYWWIMMVMVWWSAAAETGQASTTARWCPKTLDLLVKIRHRTDLLYQNRLVVTLWTVIPGGLRISRWFSDRTKEKEFAC